VGVSTGLVFVESFSHVSAGLCCFEFTYKFVACTNALCQYSTWRWGGGTFGQSSGPIGFLLLPMGLYTEGFRLFEFGGAYMGDVHVLEDTSL